MSTKKQKTLKSHAGTKLWLFGNTAQGLPILAYSFGWAGPRVLILGGVHGDEPEGNYIALGLLQRWMRNFKLKLKVCLIPCFNMEGSLLCERLNGNQVDLNRNLPTKTWTSKAAKKRYSPGPAPVSESENKALVKWIDEKKPQLIISLHSWNPMINTNGDCQPEASILSKATGYKLADHIGYPTPGSLGDFGDERGIPVITYEAKRGLSVKEALAVHVPAIEKALLQGRLQGRNS